MHIFPLTRGAIYQSRMVGVSSSVLEILVVEISTPANSITMHKGGGMYLLMDERLANFAQ